MTTALEQHLSELMRETLQLLEQKQRLIDQLIDANEHGVALDSDLRRELVQQAQDTRRMIARVQETLP